MCRLMRLRAFAAVRAGRSQEKARRAEVLPRFSSVPSEGPRAPDSAAGARVTS
jgi:hypothetical protein